MCKKHKWSKVFELSWFEFSLWSHPSKTDGAAINVTYKVTSKFRISKHSDLAIRIVSVVSAWDQSDDYILESLWWQGIMVRSYGLFLPPDCSDVHRLLRWHKFGIRILSVGWSLCIIIQCQSRQLKCYKLLSPRTYDHSVCSHYINFAHTGFHVNSSILLFPTHVRQQ